jgi:L-threonylcarbamoyladenylate synthase
MATQTLDTAALAALAPEPAARRAAEVAVRLAGEVLRAGGLVVYPTETFYGLAAAIDQPAAVARLAALKGRGEHKPFALIAPDMGAVRAVAHVPPEMARLADAMWPGPLTLVLPARRALAAQLVGSAAPGDPLPWGSVGVRVSSHPVAAALSAEVGVAITATSANLAGAAPVTTCAALSAQICSGVDLVLDGGPLPGGQPSTLVRWANGAPDIVRAGAFDLSSLQRALAGTFSGVFHGR